MHFFSSILFGLAIDLYTYLTGRQNETRILVKLQIEKNETELAKLRAQLAEIRRRRVIIFWNTIKNLFDLPVATEGTFKTGRFNPGLLNLTGTIASLTSLYLVWPK